jgi:hypothetical protein
VISFSDVESEEIPFLKVEFDNSLNIDPFDVNLRVLLIAGSASTVILDRPVPALNRSEVEKLLGRESRVGELVERWQKSSSVPLHIYTHKLNPTLDEWKLILQTIVSTDKGFDIIIVEHRDREGIREAAWTFSEATRRDGSIKPLVITSFQISAADAISYMTNPAFVFPRTTPGAAPSGPATPSNPTKPAESGEITPTPQPKPNPDVITTPDVIGSEQPDRIRRSRASETETLLDVAEGESAPRAALRAAAIDAATIPNLENLCILPVPPIKGADGQTAGVNDLSLAIQFAAAVANAARESPSRPFNGLTLDNVQAFRRQDSYSRQELNDLVKNGLSACSLNGDGKIVLERVVTTRRQNANGEEDYSLADANVNLIDNFLKKTFNNYFWENYISRRAILVDDNAVIPANVDFPVIKPRTAKADALNVYRVWQQKLVVQDEDAFLESLRVERDGKELKFSFKARYIQGLLGIRAKIQRAR